ncbi:MAG: YigZ family protein [Bacteroidetes bacterium]|nr:YigZ family protein [Bacteroidota bacterium]
MLFDNEYKTILACSVGEFKDRGSRFIGYAYSVNSEKEVKEIVSKLKKRTP